MDTVTAYFGIIDYVVFAAMILVSVAIGIYMSFKGNKSPEEFLMGNRAFHPIPVAMSLLTSIVSAISLLGFSGEVYTHGIQFSLLICGMVFGILTAKHITMPVLFPLKLTSINEYIEIRFKSKALRTAIMVLSTFKNIIYLGVCLYAPTIALTSATPLSTNTYIFLLGGICTLYSTIGGMKAIVWTDVFQLSVMLLGLIVIVTLGCVNLGGIVKMWSIAAEGGRLNMFNMDASFYQRHNFYNLITSGYFLFLSLYGISQMNVQRMCSVKTIKDATRILDYNIFGMVFIYFLILTAGLIGYATYAGCDPLALGKIEKGEQIVAYFVIDKLSHIWGLPGLFVATIIGGTLSSLSSVISGIVAQTWKDGFMQFRKFQLLSTSAATLINKCITMVVGGVLIGFAVLTSKAKNISQFVITISAACYGPILGVFMLGLLFPRSNLKGAWFGLVISYIVICWITLGSFFYGEKAVNLPLSTELCTNFTSETEQIHYSDIDSFDNSSSIIENVENSLVNGIQFEFPLQRLYKIPYTLYSLIAFTLCISIGMLVSLITGLENMKNVNPAHITPLVRKWYWKKVQEQKLMLYQTVSDMPHENKLEEPFL